MQLTFFNLDATLGYLAGHLMDLSWDVGPVVCVLPSVLMPKFAKRGISLGRSYRGTRTNWSRMPRLCIRSTVSAPLCTRLSYHTGGENVSDVEGYLVWQALSHAEHDRYPTCQCEFSRTTSLTFSTWTQMKKRWQLFFIFIFFAECSNEFMIFCHH